MQIIVLECTASYTISLIFLGILWVPSICLQNYFIRGVIYIQYNLHILGSEFMSFDNFAPVCNHHHNQAKE